MSRNVIYLGGFELPDKNAAAQRVIANAKAMRKLGFEVVLVGLTKDKVREEFMVEGFKSYDIAYPNGFLKWISFLFNIKRELELIQDLNIDTLILYNFPAFKMLLLYNRFRNTPTEIYADITEWYVASGLTISNVVKRFDVWLRMKIIHRKLDGLIVISRFLESHYKKKSNKVIYIPPLVDAKESKWDLKIERPNYNSEFNLIYAGSPGNGQKDRIDLIIKVINEVNKVNDIIVHLDIIGITKEQFKISFKGSQLEFLDEYEIPVSFHGRIPHGKALEFLKKADYSIFFRDDNLVNRAGFPTKFVESITAGTPVITNYSSNLREYFETYSFIGLGIDSLEEIEIRNVLLKAVSSNKEDVIKLKEQCHQSKLFDYNNFLNLFTKLFNQR